MSSEQAIREQRGDPYLGTVVNVVRSRQDRPNLPVAGGPFCVGGLEASDDDDVMSFTNRWRAALGEGRCEVVLYAPDHDATFSSWSGDVSPWFDIELVSPWRAAGVPRFIAAAELARDEFFDPVAPEVASSLREVSP